MCMSFASVLRQFATEPSGVHRLSLIAYRVVAIATSASDAHATMLFVCTWRCQALARNVAWNRVNDSLVITSYTNNGEVEYASCVELCAVADCGVTSMKQNWVGYLLLRVV